MNVFTLNSQTGHSARYVAWMHACVHLCSYTCVYESEGDIVFTPPGVYGNVKSSDDIIISVIITETVVF